VIALVGSASLLLSCAPSRPANGTFDLRDYGATGDGVADDGPALQSALRAMAAAGGGTLHLPAGHYAILTPVDQDFRGAASAVTIRGVASNAAVAPAGATADQLAQGLDLVSELLPRTGPRGKAVTLRGLDRLSIRDIAFVGTPDVETDALVTLALDGIEEATVAHCEFYGLSSRVAGGAIVLAERSHLTIAGSAFLGSTAESSLYAPVVENLEWKGITVADTVFVDYGQRGALYGKLGLGPPLSWIDIGNAAPPTSDSPRREVVIRNVFLDEGGWMGITRFPGRHGPPSAPIDLVYVTGLRMNVSKLGTSGHSFDRIERVLIEDSHYGRSQNTDSAIHLLGVGEAILSRLACVDGIRCVHAAAETGRVTVIDSVYTRIDSLAQTSDVIPAGSAAGDPVLYVRQRFAALAGRAPDAAAHFYWSRRILHCGEDASCVADRRRELDAYLASSPRPSFSISGTVTREDGAPLRGLPVTLSGSQSVATVTNGDGRYHFAGLPTSGVYTVRAWKPRFTIPPRTFTTPAGDCVADITAVPD